MIDLPGTYERNVATRRQLEADIKEAEEDYNHIRISGAPQWEIDSSYDRYMRLWKRLNG